MKDLKQQFFEQRSFRWSKNRTRIDSTIKIAP